MPKVYYLPDKIEVEVKEGETLLKTAVAAGIPHVNVCGGIGRCSTCRVIVSMVCRIVRLPLKMNRPLPRC